jgi:hypothetical protein
MPISYAMRRRVLTAIDSDPGFSPLDGRDK